MHKLFPSQRPDEKIYLAIREHWILLVLKLLVWLIVAVPLFAYYWFGQRALPGLFEGQMGLFLNLLAQVYMTSLLVSLLVIFVLYYLNIHIISSMRIVDIDQQGLLSHVVSELNIDKIEDVTSETNGVLGTMFDFGTVYIQTAAAKERFEFQNVPNPGLLTKIILDLYEKIHHAEQSKEQIQNHKIII